MKKLIPLIIVFLIILQFYACKNSQPIFQQENQDNSTKSYPTNNFFDNSETTDLTPVSIEIAGEVSNPGKADLSQLNYHSVIVKETVLNDDGSEIFIGAYRYDGYALSEIIDPFILNKSNAEEFPPLIDLFVEIENDKGEKVVLSWGEIYYANHLHEIIIAKRVMRIVPEKTKDMWPLPIENKLIIGSDLITERNINNPSKITIKTYPKEMVIEKGKYPLTSSTVEFSIEGVNVETFTELPKNHPTTWLHTIFYGKGRGLHSTKPFQGMNCKDYFLNTIPLSKEAIQKGIFVFGAEDGYRVVFTYSEICNRNDQQYSILMYQNNSDKGNFRIFPSCDFFSDRAVKGITNIWYSEQQQ
jgi:hypothetical protein